jgi:hypothetical protein
MKTLHVLAVAMGSAALMGASREALALNLPASGSCSDAELHKGCLQFTSNGVTGSYGLHITSKTQTGQHGDVFTLYAAAQSNDALAGLAGDALGSGTGVFGQANGTGAGVSGFSAAMNGVVGEVWASSAPGVEGINNSGGYGVAGRVFGSKPGAGICGAVSQGAAWAGYFSGAMYFGGIVDPISNSQYDLGTSSLNFNNIYVRTASTCSDRRLKTDIEDLRYGSRELLEIRPVSFRWKDDAGGERRLGFIAQELEKVIPELVVRGKDESETLGVRLFSMAPILINAMKEQEPRLAALERRGFFMTSSVFPWDFDAAALLGGVSLALVGVLRGRKHRPGASRSESKGGST